VIPSIPGFGFSEAPRERGWTLEDTAELWAILMTDVLGYGRFAASGTDWGSGITRLLAHKYSDRLLGIYLSNVGFPDFTPEPSELSEDEEQYLGAQQGWMWTEGGYAAIQGTRPQTIGYGLNDSPVGLAAWLIDKFRSLSDCSGDIEKRFSKDELLTNIMIYWVSETANSAARIYFEPYTKTPPLEPGQRIGVPAGIGLFSEAPPREWVERTLNVKRWTPMPKGGHFAAMEEPELLAGDMRAFFDAVLTP
jgi:pimeloyl-ACP methyl ester carboxylesterase